MASMELWQAKQASTVEASGRAQTTGKQTEAMLEPCASSSPHAHNEGMLARSSRAGNGSKTIAAPHPLLARGETFSGPGQIQPRLAFMPHHAERPDPIVRQRRRHGRDRPPPTPKPQREWGPVDHPADPSPTNTTQMPLGDPEGCVSPPPSLTSSWGDVVATPSPTVSGELFVSEDLQNQGQGEPLQDDQISWPSEGSQFSVEHIPDMVVSDSELEVIQSYPRPHHQAEDASTIHRTSSAPSILPTQATAHTFSEDAFLSIFAPPAVTPTSSDDEGELQRVARLGQRISYLLAREERFDGIIHRPGQVKFGDHSIHTDRISDTPIYMIEEVIAESDYISRGYLLADIMSDNFQLQDNQYIIKSWMVPVAQPLTVGAGVIKNGIVFQTTPQAIDNQNLTTAKITFSSTSVVGGIDEVDLTPFLGGNLPDGRKISSLLTPLLRPANHNLIAESASILTSGLTYFDNSALYAKLLWHALLQDVYSAVQANPIANGFGADDTITWVNLSDPNLAPATFMTALTGNSITLMEGMDFDHSEIQYVLWLARAGRRVYNEAAARTPLCNYVDWPSINICILSHQARPAQWPVAAMLNSSQLFAFCEKLANMRNEWKSCLTGLYRAMDILGVMYGMKGTDYRPINMFMGLSNLQVPAPGDYNIFCRLAGLMPPVDSHARQEYNSALSRSSAGRVRGMALYIMGHRLLATTLLYSLSIQTTNLIHWCSANAPEGGVNMVLQSGLVGPRAGAEGESIMYSVVKQAFERFFGFRLEKRLYKRCLWLPPNGALPSAGDYYFPLPSDDDEAPRFCTCLCIDDFLLERPQEWAILGPQTAIDLRLDLCPVGAPHTRGVFSDRGDSTYNQRLSSNAPYLLVPYGVQLLNAIHQHFELGDLTPQYRPAVFTGAGGGMFNMTPVQYESHKYIDDLFIYEPCTIWTFDWGDHTVRAPCFYGATQLTKALINGLLLWRGTNIPEIGFVLPRMLDNILNALAPPPYAGISGLASIIPGGGSHPTGAPDDPINRDQPGNG